MSETQQSATLPVREGPEGIGGWLILPMLGLILTPLTGLVGLKDYIGLSETFHLLTVPQQIFLVVEIIGNLVIAVILPIILLVLLFSKKLGFPRLYIAWAIANLVFVLADLIAAKILFGDVFEAQGVSLIDQETARSIGRSIVLVVIWIPYMLNSQRVQNTFTQ